MLTIELTDEEVELLAKRLESDLSGKAVEISHTDNRVFRNALKDDAERLEALLQKLRSPSAVECVCCDEF